MPTRASFTPSAVKDINCCWIRWSFSFVCCKARGLIENRMFIYLDESGDLGFDWNKAGTSRYFTITLLVCDSVAVMQEFQTAVKRTLRRKINTKKKKKPRVQELKGTNTTLEVKRYFYRQAPKEGWGIYSVTIDKQRVIRQSIDKQRLYNVLVRFLAERLPLETVTQGHVNLIVDKCKNKAEIEDFDTYLLNHLQSRLPLQTRLYISHESSHNRTGLQAVDLFCWGIFRERVMGESEWFREFSAAIRCNETYNP